MKLNTLILLLTLFSTTFAFGQLSTQLTTNRLNFFEGADIDAYLNYTGLDLILSNTEDFGWLVLDGKESVLFRVDGTTQMALQEEGLGIGTFSPDQKLHVLKGSAGFVTGHGNSISVFENNTNGYLSILTPDANERGILFGEPNSNVAGGIIYNNSSTPDGLQFRTNGNITRMVIGNDGTAAIGTSFVNNARLYLIHSSTEDVGIWSENDATGTDTRWGMFARADGTGTGQRNGIHGIAPTANPGYAVLAGGDLGYTGGLINASDRKLKKNIDEFDAMEIIMKLQPKTYDFKVDEYAEMNLAIGKRYGFIAQELREVLPELVKESNYSLPSSIDEKGKEIGGYSEDFLGVDYVSLVPILTQAIQEQQTELEDKDEQIVELKDELDEVKERLAKLEAILGNQQPTTNNQQLSTNNVQLTDAKLEQNQPNPFNGSTTVRFFIPNEVKRAELRVTDLTGKVIKSVAIQARGEGQITFDATTLGSGTYQYSLFLDNQLLDTKQMVLTKN